jgi:hypothetical protein
MYNQAYAPDYPAEDRTTLERQLAEINAQIAETIQAAEKREDVADWLRLATLAVAAAFEKYQKGDQDAYKEIEAAIRYIRNASSDAPHKRTFVTMPDGTTKRVG